MGNYTVSAVTKKERIKASMEAIKINMDYVDWFSLLEASKGKRVA